MLLFQFMYRHGSRMESMAPFLVVLHDHALNGYRNPCQAVQHISRIVQEQFVAEGFEKVGKDTGSKYEHLIIKNISVHKWYRKHQTAHYYHIRLKGIKGTIE